MANTRFGWHSGSLTCKDLTLSGDMNIGGSLTFGDASTDTLTVNGASQFNAAMIVGVNDTGYDVKFFGATSGAYMLWDESADDLILAGAAGLSVAGTSTFAGLVDINNKLDVEDSQAGGASNGSVIKKNLISGEAYTGTTAGLMIKNYGEDGTETVPSGEFCGLYVNLKGLHTDPGNNTSLISAHVHASNTTVVHAGLWLYGDMTNGVKMSGSTLTSAIDISEATAVTNLFDLPAAGTAPVIANALVPAAAPDAGTMGADACIQVDVNGTPMYIPLYDTLHA